MSDSPVEEYAGRLEQRRRTLAGLRRVDARVSAARFVTFGGAALLWAVGWVGMASYWWLRLPSVVFIVLLVVHDRVIRGRETAASAVTWARAYRGSVP